MKQQKKVTQFVLLFLFLFFQIIAIAQTSKQDEQKKSGYFILFETPISIGMGSVSVAGHDLQNEDMAIGFRMITGIQEHRNIFLGVGFGIDKYQNIMLMPLTLDFRIPFSNDPITPMFILNGGYSIGIGDAIGGVIIDPALAFKIDIKDKNASVFFAIGYKWQQSEIDYTYLNYRNRNIYPTYKADVFVQFLTFNVGFYF